MREQVSRKEDLKCMNPEEVNDLLRFRYGRGSVYEDGTFITRTLDVISNEKSLLCHDERTFQLLHLQTEIAWYNIHFELRAVIRCLDSGRFASALTSLERVICLAQLPITALEIMIATISQYELMAFRALLPDNATGIDSPGMINLRYASRTLWASFERALELQGYTPSTLALARIGAADLPEDLRLQATFFDAIQQLDIRLMNWKQQHLRMVWMHLGGAMAASEHERASPDVEASPAQSGPARPTPTSLRGRPITELQRMTATPLFPKLWQVSVLVYQEMSGLRGRLGGL